MTSTMPSHDDLKDAGCWFDADKAGGQMMTAFKREARWRQHRWAVDELGIVSFGTHAGRRTFDETPVEDIPNGTKLGDGDAEAGANFLTPEIHRIARARVAEKQDHQTLDAKRLYRDLLSSMPMAFNLFGEASLPENHASRRRLAELFGVPDAEPSAILFEWSPGRGSDLYTRDRTAFDVALVLGRPNAPLTVLGVETKYHEHSAKDPKPSADRPAAVARHEDQTEFLIAVAEASGVFRPGWQDKVLDTALRQIWRDHLLALSMRNHPDQWTPQTRYVLLHPTRNVSFTQAAAAYADLLVDGDTSFSALTLEQTVDAAFAHGGPVKEAFVRRYLW
ncbi:PGN_0703 family putative restriction endonuclease [Nocardioides sp. YJ-D4]